MSKKSSPTQFALVLNLLPRKLLSLTIFKWTFPISLVIGVTSNAERINTAQDLITWLIIGALGHLSMLPFLLYGRSKPFPEQVLLLLLMGFTRGAVIGIFAPIFGLEDSLPALLRALNSLVAVFYWFQAGAIIIEYGREFRNKLRTLLSEVLEKNIVGFSDQAKNSNNKIVEMIGVLQEKIVATVGNSPTKSTLESATREIDQLIIEYVKPLSQSRWRDGELIWVRAGLFSVLKRTLTQNPIPVVAVIVLTFPFTLISQISTIGLIQTLLVQFVWTSLMLILIKIVFLKRPSNLNYFSQNILFLACLPIPYILTFFVQLTAAISPVQTMSQMIVGYLVSLFAQAIFYLIGNLLLSLNNDQEFVFEFISDVIKAGEIENLLQKTKIGNLDARYAQYLHAEVQSQLLACKLLLLKAAESDFALFPPEVTRQIIERMERIKQPYEKPVARIPSQRVEELKKSWAGLAEIEYELPDECGQLHPFSDITSQLIEEAIVNSIRHGKATLIQIGAKLEGDNLTVEIRDNGTFKFSKTSPGLGTILFETFSKNWKLTEESDGTVLVFQIDTQGVGTSR